MPKDKRKDPVGGAKHLLDTIIRKTEEGAKRDANTPSKPLPKRRSNKTK